jgi:hypothetical protein
VVRSRRTPYAVLLGLLLPAAVRGEEALGVLAVAEPPGPTPELVARAGALRSALAARVPGVLEAAALRERMTTAAPPAVLPELERAYAGALAAHLAGEYETSNRTLRSVLEALERLPDGPEVFAAWSRTLLRLARSEQELGRAVEAQAVLERLLHAAPETRADARQFPPSFLALVEQARARQRALGTRRLTVEAHAGARVFVDGREVGAAPVTVELPPGRHRVSGLRGGLRSPTVILDVTDDRAVQLDLSLAEAMRPDAGPGLALAGPPSAGVGAIAARLALDRAVAVSLHRAGDATSLDATLLDVRRGTSERQARIALTAEGSAADGAIEALAAFVAAGERSPLVVVVRETALAVTPEAAERILGGAPSAEDRARTARIVRWTAVGAGVAAVGVGVAAVVLGRDAQASYDRAGAMKDASGRVALPRTVADYNSALDHGDRQRRLAIGTGVAAGACAITSAVLSWWSWRSTGEVGPLRF